MDASIDAAAAMARTAGLAEEPLHAWRTAQPPKTTKFAEDSAYHARFWRFSDQLVAGLPPSGRRTPAQAEAAAAIHHAARATRQRFLRQHIEAVYAVLTAGFTRFVRVEDVVVGAAEAFPGLVPDSARLAAEAGLKLGEKDGLELDQSILLASILAHQRCGLHLCHAMLLPRPESTAALATLDAQGYVDLGAVRLERHGAAVQPADQQPAIPQCRGPSYDCGHGDWR